MSFDMFHGAGRYSERLKKANDLRKKALAIYQSGDHSKPATYYRHLKSIRRADRIYSEIYWQESRLA